MIEFVEFDGKISAFVISGKKIRFVPDLTTSAEVGRSIGDLQFHFGALRYGKAIAGRFLDEMKARSVDCLKRLFDQLLRPISAFFSGERLTIVSVGLLHYVPFHALHDGRKYVIENFETSYAPSAAVWSSLQGRPTKKIKNSLLMGFADERIPLVENEIRQIKGILPDAKTFVGKEASFSTFMANAPKYDLIHLACHGQFRAESPMFSSLHLADGWITVCDICSQKLRASLVTLSACETGLNKVFAGDEILGLARGLLTAGADALIVSLWSVNDESAGRLMQDLYQNLQRGESVSASLRAAQTSFVERGEHPYFWSPFILIGK
jgi:CHAT domain-containing protein